jgi:glucose/arabinose dehydrogenase
VKEGAIWMKVEEGMNKLPKSYIFAMAMALATLLSGCEGPAKPSEPKAESVAASAGSIALPEPFASKSVTKRSKVIGWPPDKTPVAAAGFVVTKFADGLVNPRNIYVGSNGDIFIAEANTEVSAPKRLAAKVAGIDKSQRLDDSPNRIVILRDANRDGVPEVKSAFLSNLNQPFGMLIIGNHFYVANTDGLWRYPYKQGDTSITQPGQKILDLPAGGYNNHWTRNLLASKDNRKIYISVGSASNVAEHGMETEARRACILEINPDGSGERIYASGLRNPVGMDWQPETNVLWTAVNERDELGDDLVPDYITSVKSDGFYGWPYSYFGQHLDPRIKEQKPELVSKAIVPDQALGAHTASLGLAFYNGSSFPAKYRNGAFVGQHGSWNRSQLSGYKVVFVPFAGGKPSGSPEDFLTGFLVGSNDTEVYGRPVGVAIIGDGSLLVADDAGTTIWRVSKQ